MKISCLLLAALLLAGLSVPAAPAASITAFTDPPRQPSPRTPKEPPRKPSGKGRRK